MLLWASLIAMIALLILLFSFFVSFIFPSSLLYALPRFLALLYSYPRICQPLFEKFLRFYAYFFCVRQGVLFRTACGYFFILILLWIVPCLPAVFPLGAGTGLIRCHGCGARGLSSRATVCPWSWRPLL